MNNSNNILDILKGVSPTMIARFGSIELKGVLYGKYPYLLRPLKSIIFKRLKRNAGFFSCDEKEVRLFSKLMIEDMKIIDVLGSWRKEEFFFSRYLKKATKTPLRNLEPYFLDNPWSQVLKGKKVLVIHPFSDTIKSQYKNNREHLFENKNVLPEFKSLQTIKAVQTIAGEKSNFKSWFDALDYMKKQIDELDFDIAIIGCGAYGFPLAAHVKRKGKKSVHMGGATQMLFGIKGSRWENSEDFKDIINKYFVSPSLKDTPQRAKDIEGGCYW
jgi:hypothetical protein